MDLVWWAERYKVISELPSGDRPPQDILENDFMLDQYLKDLNIRRQQKSK